MRVNLKVSFQFPVPRISSKQQVTSPQSQVLPPYITRHQGEILKIPRSPFRERQWGIWKIIGA